MNLFPIACFLVDHSVEGRREVERLRTLYPKVPAQRLEAGQDPRDALERLGVPPSRNIVHLSGRRGASFKECQGMTDKTLCCGLYILDQAENCPFDCSYCFLRGYLSDPITTLCMDTEGLLEEARAFISARPGRLFRVGTGELADSLAFESLTGFARKAVPFFASLPNAVLELKTKSTEVESLLELPHGGRTVVSWSVNPPAVIDREEPGTPSLDERLEAARRAAGAGYMVGFHFDPMIEHADFEKNYADVADRMFAAVPAERIAWISVGSLRYPSGMKRTVLDRFPRSKAMLGEMVPGFDGKMRYWRKKRWALYRSVIQALNGRDVFVYFCMETPEAWRELLGVAPRSSEHLDEMLSGALLRKFPHLGMQNAPGPLTGLRAPTAPRAG
jgi:spore photoproduct lyase